LAEDQVLEAIVSLCRGKSREDVMNTLYGQLETSAEELAKDQRALEWFNLTQNTPSKSSTATPTEVSFPGAPNFMK